MPIMNIVIILIIMLHFGPSDGVSNDKDLFILNLTMKNYQSTKEDQIVFVQYKLPDEELTIVGYTPLVSLPSTHHMDSFACENPYSPDPFWLDGQACGTGAQMLLYGWDRDALPFHFPEEVGVAVGKNTPYKYIIVNIHYLPIVKNDYSGNQFLISRKRGRYLAGVVLAGTNSIYLPPHTHTIKTPFSCQYNGPKISIIAAGVHAHRWARVNSMYRVRDKNLTLIIKGDPQQTHQSYLLPSPIEIVDGDYLVGQCVFDNDDDRAITVGLGHNDEMCNVMAGYSYDLNNHKQDNAKVPLELCWSHTIPHLSALIPPDSEIPPSKTSNINKIDQDKHIDGEHVMTTSTDLSTHTFYKSFITVVVFGIAFLLAVIIGRLIRMKTFRGLDCLNTVFDKEIYVKPSQCSIFSNWFNRSDGFEPLEQSSDGENELANNEV